MQKFSHINRKGGITSHSKDFDHVALDWVGKIDTFQLQLVYITEYIYIYWLQISIS